MKLINLTQGKTAKVDDHWFDKLINFGSWCYDTGYAVTRQGGKKIYMHHVIRPIDLNSLYQVDHIDRDKTNNQEENLRLTTSGTNMRNSGPRRGNKFKGTKLIRSTGRYQSRATIRGVEINLGVYATEVEAAKAYDMAMVRNYGKQVYLNFPEDYAS